MKTLLEDYQRRLRTVEDTIMTTENTGSRHDIEKMARLKTKAGEYRAFIVEIEKAIKREHPEAPEPKKRLEKLEALSYADLKALYETCNEKMDYYQRRFPKDKKMHKDIYAEQYDLWIEWYSLSVALELVMTEFVKKLRNEKEA